MQITRTTKSANGKHEIVATFYIESKRYTTHILAQGVPIELSCANISEEQAKAISELYKLVNHEDSAQSESL